MGLGHGRGFPAQAYRIWAEPGPTGAASTNTRVGDRVSAMRELNPEHGGHIQRFSSVHGGGLLRMRAARNPALDTSAQQGRTAARKPLPPLPSASKFDGIDYEFV